MSMADRIAVMHDGRVQQVADPVTLYSQPANVFVADFIGNGTLIPGTVSGDQFNALGTTVPATNAQNLNGSAVLMLRPEGVRLMSPDGALLAGTVVETHFYGGTSTTTIAVTGLEAPIIASHPGSPDHRSGDSVGITWRAESAVVLREDA